MSNWHIKINGKIYPTMLRKIIKIRKFGLNTARDFLFVKRLKLK
jgi:hypothetical protein